MRTQEEVKHLRALRREKKKRPKMAVHGRSVKSRPSRGVLKVRTRRS